MRRHYGLVVLMHAVVTAMVLTLALLHARYIGHYSLLDEYRYVWLGFFIAALTISAYGAGLPDEGGEVFRSRVGAAFASVLTAAIAISLLQLALGSALLPRFVVFWSSLFAVPWNALLAAVSADLKRTSGGARVLAVVSAEEAARLSTELHSGSERDATLVACVPPNEIRADPPDAVTGDRYSVEVVVLNREAMADPETIAWASRIHARGIRVRSLSLFYEEWLGKLPISELEPVSLMFDVGELHRRLYARQKRVADFLAGLVLSVLVGAAVPFVLIGNMVGNRGSLFFRQERVGRGGDVFTIYKFRTMRPGEKNSEWTSDGDQRVTPFGRLLRRSHLDEIPQGLNVLKGDISIVGPRPEQPDYVRQLREAIPFYDVRHIIRPGITGWAQIKFAYGASIGDTREKLQYDFFYLRRQSVQLDARIVVRTLRSVFMQRGR